MPQIFYVEEDLIRLRSAYFANRLRERDQNRQRARGVEPYGDNGVEAPNEDKPIVLPRFKPSIFGTFITVMKSGDFVLPNVILTPTFTEELWALGCIMKAPFFQNFIMEDIRIKTRMERKHWFYSSRLESTYTIA
jgi:hypothetical protein